MKLEAVEVGAKSFSLRARYETGATTFTNFTGLAKRVDLGGADRLADSDEGVFQFFDSNPSRIVTSGMESNWITAAH